MERAARLLAASLLTASFVAGTIIAPVAHAGVSVDELARAYAESVDKRLEVPEADARRYAQLTQSAFDRAGIGPGAQYVVTVDRSGWVQAAFLFWHTKEGQWQLIGASPVSTGWPGSFDHFETPTGVFEHTTANMDFRAEGTFNSNGIRGYGLKGMRVFDFGWQAVPKGWGDGNVIDMRLQMHATDPDLLEQRLGTAQSKGCIRIPATMNKPLDHYGVLDAAYNDAQPPVPAWVLPEDRAPVDGAGRWLVVVDSERTERPDWAPAPYLPRVRR